MSAAAGAEGAATKNAKGGEEKPQKYATLGERIAAGGRKTVVWRSAQALMRIGCKLAFDFKAYGIENVPRAGPVLLLSNHQSYLDPVLLGVELNRPMSYMAKSELFRNTFFATIIRTLNAFPIEQRGNATAAMRESLRLLSEGRMLNIFPEGTRTPDGQLQPVMAGAALVIRRTKAVVVPVAIDGSYESWPRWRKVFGQHPIHILYGKPLDLSGLDTKRITQIVEATLQAMLDDLRSRRPERWRNVAPPRGWTDD